MKRSLAANVRAVEFSKQIEGVRVGKIVSLDESGQVLVDFPGNTQGLVAARLTSSIKSKLLNHAASADKEVLLAFEDNNPELPIIIDTLYSLVDEITDYSTIALETERKDVLIDGKRVTFDAKEEIVLRCGKASITLTNVGKVIIRGAYLLNRSSGVNRIKGGSVQIN
jgi:sorbitol-specific phosphotransferase system component IIA